MKTDTNINNERQHRTAYWMVLLLAVFLVRVIGQLIVVDEPIAYLPHFEDWHSNAMAYKYLLLSQLVILLVGIQVCWRLFTSSVTPRPTLGRVLYFLGWVYWTSMFIRLVLGLNLFNEVHWFEQHLPALFHLVLANMLMLIGDYHRKGSKS